MAKTTTNNPTDALLAIKNAGVSGQTYSAARWTTADSHSSGTTITLTYSFESFLPSYYGLGSYNYLGSMSSVEQAAVEAVLKSISEVVNINFVRVSSGVGDLAFMETSFSSYFVSSIFNPGGKTAGFSYLPTPENKTLRIAGDIFLNSDSKVFGSTIKDTSPGSYFYTTILHEVSHILELIHSFNEQGKTWVLPPGQNDFYHTVMTYNLENVPRDIYNTSSTTCSFPGIFPNTLMPLDIEALQILYGANTLATGGNNTYRWANKAELFQTIWDGGGIDTIDCSNQTLVCQINLQAGAYSSIGLRQTTAEIIDALNGPWWLLQQTEDIPAYIYISEETTWP